MTLTHKEKTTALQESIGGGGFEQAGLTHIDPFRYVQHNVGIPSGRAAILALHDQLPVETTQARVVRAFHDGDYAFVHVDYHLWGPTVAFDIHRYENERTVEHWDNLQATAPAPNPSGRTMIDGETEVRDLDRTGENKTLVARYVEDVLVRGKFGTAPRYFDGDRLIQHNPRLSDGVAALVGDLRGDSGRETRYIALHRVLGEGNFVLAVCEGYEEGRHSAFYDLYRAENGKIAEHWDVIEEIPARELWKNQNGKF